MSKYIRKILLRRHETVVTFNGINITTSIEYFAALTTDNTFTIARTYVLFKNKPTIFSSIFLSQKHNKDAHKDLIKRINTRY